MLGAGAPARAGAVVCSWLLEVLPGLVLGLVPGAGIVQISGYGIGFEGRRPSRGSEQIVV